MEKTIKIILYNKDKEEFITVKNELDLLWWLTHLLDKIPKMVALQYLNEIDTLLDKKNDPNLLYWFIRFIKDNNPFLLDREIKEKIKQLIKKYKKKIEELYTNEIPFEKYLIQEPLEIIEKYW